MDLRQLRYFVQVAELGSFTKAAAMVGVAQSALSRRVRKLEDELGISLLLRNGRGVVVTDAGAIFCRRARSLLEEAEDARREMQELQGRPTGMVSIGLPPGISAVLTVPLVERIDKELPGIQLQITEGYSGHVHEWLLGGRVDIGILYNVEQTPTLTYEPLANERLYLFGAPGRAASLGPRLSFKALSQLPLILPAQPHAIRRLIDGVSAKLHVSLDITLEVTAFTGIRDLVLAGRGFTIFPVAPLLMECRAGVVEVIELVDPPLSQVVGLATSTHHPPSLATKTVARCICKLAASLVRSRRWPERLVRQRRPKRPAESTASKSLRSARRAR